MNKRARAITALVANGRRRIAFRAKIKMLKVRTIQGLNAGAVLADPAWSFAVRSPKGEGRSASQHYACMTLEAIAALPVAEWAASDSWLFLWATTPMLPQALCVMESWGFTYSGNAFAWVKLNPSGVGFHMGCGFTTRKNLELCLLGKRGRPRINSHSVRELIVAPRREHSRKPDEQYARIERLVAGPYLELFARQQWPGWTAVGDEVDRFTSLQRVAS
jgi:N6-adenosine-specific RNA methylase IME4